MRKSDVSPAYCLYECTVGLGGIISAKDQIFSFGRIYFFTSQAFIFSEVLFLSGF
ncbi:MAG: hypothetical protein QG581_182 [Patescibacteria group bacterium]|jgi:hypothetical protein|nr:hypothetical protein [Patescibacteria group bacterium]